MIVTKHHETQYLIFRCVRISIRGLVRWLVGRLVLRLVRRTVDPQMGSAAMKGKKQGCVNRSSLEHSMVITLVHSEFELEAIWLLFYGWTALLKWQKWKNDENRSKSPSILRKIIFPENRLIADFFCSIPSNRIQMEVKKWLASYVSVFCSSHGQNLGRANNLICIL